jgi:uncharacterized membrane protein YbhN (UPF0104 family)
VRAALRVGVGLAVLALVAWHADLPSLAAALRGASPSLFAAAALTAICANLVSSARWAAIARALGLTAPTLRLVPAYARGITANTLLPGGTLSGDLLRSYQLARMGNPFLRCALSVFFDRFSGLWVLCVMSLLAALGLALSGLAHAGLPAGTLGYVAALGGIVLAPFLPWPTGWLRVVAIRPLLALALKLDQLRERIRSERGVLLRSVWLSVLVQVLSALALWICLRAVGAELSYFATLAAAAPIFIMAALPLGVAGFGTRELGAVLVLGFLGVPADQATAASLLFGLTVVAQGLLGAPLFLLKA